MSEIVFEMRVEATEHDSVEITENDSVEMTEFELTEAVCVPDFQEP